MVLGISPPMPIPVQNRSTRVAEYPCCQICRQRGHTIDDTARQQAIAALRPYQSPILRPAAVQIDQHAGQKGK